MNVGKIQSVNQLSNISFYTGKVVEPVKRYKEQENEFAVYGNPNHPESRNYDVNAGSPKGLNVYYLA